MEDSSGGLGIVELEEGDVLELPARPPVVIKTDDSYVTNFKNLEELGKGKFGVVYKAKRKLDGEVLAAKFVRKSASSKREVQREIQMMNLLHHKRLIQLYDAYETKQDMIVIMELVTGGELFEKVVEEDNLTEKQVIRYMKQVLYGVQHMHRKQMVHLDLKPENILCLGGGKQGYEEIKLIDFGMTRVLKDGETETAMCGTPEFVAPEVITFNPITVQADMWSIGVITYVLLSGLSPFMGDDDSETLKNVTSGEYDFEDDDDIFEHLSNEVKLFIQDLLVLNPTDRLTVDECLEHSWLRNEGSEKKLKTSNLKKFIARRRWQRTMNTIKAVSRLAGGLSLFSAKKESAHGVGKGKFLDKVKAQQAAEEAAEKVRKEKEAAEKAQKDKEAAEKARKEKEAAEKAEKEKEAVEKARKEKEAAAKAQKKKEAAEKSHKEKEATAKAQKEEEAAEKAQKEKEAAAKAQKEKEAAEKSRKEKDTAAKTQKEKEAAEKSQKEKEAAAKAQKEKEAVEKAQKEKEAAEKARKEKEAAEKVQQERELTAKDRKEREAAEKAARKAEEKKKKEEQARKEKEEKERLKKEEAEKKRMEKAAAEEARKVEKKQKEEMRKKEKLERKSSLKEKITGKTPEKNGKLTEEERKQLRDEERKRRQEERKKAEENNKIPTNTENSTSSTTNNNNINVTVQTPVIKTDDTQKDNSSEANKPSKPRQVIKLRPGKQINLKK